MSRKKRVLVLTDTHCGSIAGLTPPDWQKVFRHGPNSKYGKFTEIREMLWNHFEETVEELRPFDVVVSLGDLVEGRGPRVSGVDVLTSDMSQQADMAMWTLNYLKPKNLVCVYGTDYHVALDGTDVEDFIVKGVKVPGMKKIGAHEWINVNGTMFDLKHKLSFSSIPHGSITPLAKARLWNAEWARQDAQPEADVILRGHVHSFYYGGSTDWLAISCPACCGMGSRYGSRECERIVHTGLIYFDCYEGGMRTWEPRILVGRSQQAQSLTF